MISIDATPIQTSSDVPPSTIDPTVRRRVVAASFIGNFVEWFDYAAYGYLATTIAKVFFPDSSPSAALLATFGVFAISFVIRPIGGLVWGHFGDKIGRRNALSLSILIMSTSTFLIAFLPTHAQIGVLAPVLLLLVRMVQGFSASASMPAPRPSSPSTRPSVSVGCTRASYRPRPPQGCCSGHCWSPS